ncbi:hypothetical protein EIN_017330 [Entamoeba invadens IP1]|uniref:hypothetical protein n=1 Tax=Entamoeba invadens IP1 TaxID=370355 RepID=UPI0002C3F89C|nr:hypothetical protein EIN_017330 [Entamoeba invadens IP1]ELP90454.1 hypothetical protein EIN_017330 [Entamoeba invadens IP1]|eukprot:XP_004257225.1 hypothetical protein EIN_017330 [Entamoeba invadens IP1]
MTIFCWSFVIMKMSNLEQEKIRSVSSTKQLTIATHFQNMNVLSKHCKCTNVVNCVQIVRYYTIWFDIKRSNVSNKIELQILSLNKRSVVNGLQATKLNQMVMSVYTRQLNNVKYTIIHFLIC